MRSRIRLKACAALRISSGPLSDRGVLSEIRAEALGRAREARQRRREPPGRPEREDREGHGDESERADELEHRQARRRRAGRHVGDEHAAVLEPHADARRLLRVLGPLGRHEEDAIRIADFHADAAEQRPGEKADAALLRHDVAGADVQPRKARSRRLEEDRADLGVGRRVQEPDDGAEPRDGGARNVARDLLGAQQQHGQRRDDLRQGERGDDQHGDLHGDAARPQVLEPAHQAELTSGVNM